MKKFKVLRLITWDMLLGSAQWPWVMRRKNIIRWGAEEIVDPRIIKEGLGGESFYSLRLISESPNFLPLILESDNKEGGRTPGRLDQSDRGFRKRIFDLSCSFSLFQSNSCSNRGQIKIIIISSSCVALDSIDWLIHQVWINRPPLLSPPYFFHSSLMTIHPPTHFTFWSSDRISLDLWDWLFHHFIHSFHSFIWSGLLIMLCTFLMNSLWKYSESDWSCHRRSQDTERL